MQEKSNNAVTELRISTSKNDSDVSPQKGAMSATTIWTIKITVVTFVLGAFFSFISELTSSIAHVSVAMILLALLIAVSITCDAIGVAVTACDLAPIAEAVKRGERGARMALGLVTNAEKVSNICCDVIGDICSIISGACTVAIAMKLIADQTLNYWVTVCFSSIVGAVTVGGKAIFKDVAIKNGNDIIMFTARCICSLRVKNKRCK